MDSASFTLRLRLRESGALQLRKSGSEVMGVQGFAVSMILRIPERRDLFAHIRSDGLWRAQTLITCPVYMSGQVLLEQR